MVVGTRMRRFGVLLMLLALAGAALVVWPRPAGAQTVDLESEFTALYAYPASDAVPDTLTESVPPVAVCIVIGGCPDETDELGQVVTDIVGTVDDEAQPLPLQPIPPDALAVALFSGAPRYASAMKIPTPSVAFGEQIDSYVVTLPEGQPTYHYSSPLFRQVIFAIFAQIQNTDDFPGIFQEELAKGLENEDGRFPPVDDATRLGIEVCPLTKAFEASPAPQALPDDEIPRDDEGIVANPDGSVPDAPYALDCLRGANGVYDAEAGTWSFDLTFAAQAWADGTLPNHGLLFQQQASENLAFGDPDPSSFFQTVLDPAGMQATIESSEIAVAGPPPPAPAPPGVSPPLTPGVAPPPPAAPQPAGPEPQPPVVEQPDAAPPVVDPTPAAAEVTTPAWWLVLMALLFAAGWFLTQRSLNAQVITTATKDGALAHLVSRSPTRPDRPAQV